MKQILAFLICFIRETTLYSPLFTYTLTSARELKPPLYPSLRFIPTSSADEVGLRRSDEEEPEPRIAGSSSGAHNGPEPPAHNGPVHTYFTDSD